MCGTQCFYAHTGPRACTTLTCVRPPLEQQLPVILSLEEVRTLLAHLTRLRSRVCLATLDSCGLRLQEGTHLQVHHQVWHKDWVTHCEPAGTGTEVITSLAPYIRRIAITNNRIETLEDGQVTVRFQESGSQAWKHRTLPAAEFIRRFLPHVLPKGFIQVRSYGFLSPHCRQALEPMRTLLEARPSHDHAAESGQHRERQETHPSLEKDLHCRKCGGPLVLSRSPAPPIGAERGRDT